MATATAESELDIAPIPEIEAAIEADAKRLGLETPAHDDEPTLEEGDDESPESGGRPRDDKGRFQSTEGDDKPKADRAGQTEDAAAGANGEGSPATGKPEAGKDQQQDQNTQIQDPKPKNQSAYAKEQERKARSWEALNSEKETYRREREQFELERKQFEEQQRAANVQRKDEHGFTAEQYQQRAAQWNARASALSSQAMEAEARGDYAAAEKLQAQAQQEATLARTAQSRAATLSGGGVTQVWQSLGADLPEAMAVGSEMNQAIRAAIRGNADLLGSPLGPYRAAVKVGRELLLKQGKELETAKAAAGKVPGLEKQLAEVSRQLSELRARTSLPGGAANLSRGGGDGDDFASMSLEQQEAWLRRNA